MKAVVGILAVACLLFVSAPAAAQNLDVAILNFALNLEYLEANFYSCAVYGYPLNGSRIGGGPVAAGCTGKALLSPAVLALANEIARDEIAHVDFLRSALGDAAVPQPAINIGSAFSDAANAAFGTELPVPFTAYGNDFLFLHGAFIFEDVGVTAYQGAAPLITDKAILAPAAAILAVEAYHAGAIRAALLDAAQEYIFPYGVTPAQATNAIAKLRNTVDGLNGTTDAGIMTMNSARSYILAPADKDAIVYSRTPKNILPIVYLGGTERGGFFPEGLNGEFKNSAVAP